MVDKVNRAVNRAFDYELVAATHHVEPAVLAELVQDARKEFPHDEMMAELHVVRALHWLLRRRAIEGGRSAEHEH